MATKKRRAAALAASRFERFGAFDGFERAFGRIVLVLGWRGNAPSVVGALGLLLAGRRFEIGFSRAPSLLGESGDSSAQQFQRVWNAFGARAGGHGGLGRVGAATAAENAVFVCRGCLWRRDFAVVSGRSLGFPSACGRVGRPVVFIFVSHAGGANNVALSSVGFAGATACVVGGFFDRLRRGLRNSLAGFGF